MLDEAYFRSARKNQASLSSERNLRSLRNRHANEAAIENVEMRSSFLSRLSNGLDQRKKPLDIFSEQLPELRG